MNLFLIVIEVGGPSSRYWSILFHTRTLIVKGMAFPLVMYGCEYWTLGRLSTEELMLLNSGAGGDS